jgi:hypothetical protein
MQAPQHPCVAVIVGPRRSGKTLLAAQVLAACAPRGARVIVVSVKNPTDGYRAAAPQAEFPEPDAACDVLTDAVAARTGPLVLVLDDVMLPVTLHSAVESHRLWDITVICTHQYAGSVHPTVARHADYAFAFWDPTHSGRRAMRDRLFRFTDAEKFDAALEVYASRWTCKALARCRAMGDHVWIFHMRVAPALDNEGPGMRVAPAPDNKGPGERVTPAPDYEGPGMRVAPAPDNEGPGEWVTPAPDNEGPGERVTPAPDNEGPGERVTPAPDYEGPGMRVAPAPDNEGPGERVTPAPDNEGPGERVAPAPDNEGPGERVTPAPDNEGPGERVAPAPDNEGPGERVTPAPDNEGPGERVAPVPDNEGPGERVAPAPDNEGPGERVAPAVPDWVWRWGAGLFGCVGCAPAVGAHK